MHSRNGFIGPIIVLALALFLGFVLFVAIPKLSQTKTTQVPSVGQSLQVDQNTDTWQHYTTDAFRLRFRYPNGFTVTAGNKRPGNETGNVAISNGKIEMQIVGYVGVHGTPLLVSEGMLIDELKAQKYIVGGGSAGSVLGVTVELTVKGQPISFLLFPKDDPRRALTPLELRLFDLFLTTVKFN